MAERKPGPVLVTGGNSGIGLASVLRLAERGWTVYATVRSQSKADTLLEHSREAEVIERVHPIVLDVSDHAAVVDAWGDLPDFHAVVNNAGYVEPGAVEEVSAERAKAQLDVNLVAPAVVASCAIPGMRRRGAGRIVMVSSMAGRVAIMPLNAWYHASKFGLEALSDILRVEVAAFGIDVVIIEPGFFKTSIGERTRQHTPDSEAREHSPYARAYDRMETLLGWIERFAPEPTRVADSIVSAIESKRPRRRYVVGLDAIAAAVSQPFTPRELTDAAMRLTSGLLTSRQD